MEVRRTGESQGNMMCFYKAKRSSSDVSGSYAGLETENEIGVENYI